MSGLISSASTQKRLSIPMNPGLVANGVGEIERTGKFGVQPDPALPTAPANSRGKGPSKALRTFNAAWQRSRNGWSEKAPTGRAHSEEIRVEGEVEPVLVKLTVWVSSTKTRRDKLNQVQLDALQKLGVDWA
ncbi:hypothetical protein [Streptomyces sp. NPDC057939]|uniref:hypothetical protein n=1 Tax=Streptomyces sp. NPDC057939 TaxID=3346284 RepID=UPI0036E047AD